MSLSGEHEHVQRYMLSDASADHPVTAAACCCGAFFAAVECTLYIVTYPARKDYCALPFAASCMKTCVARGVRKRTLLVVGGFRGALAVFHVLKQPGGRAGLQELSRARTPVPGIRGAAVTSLAASAAAPLLPAVICGDDAGCARLWALDGAGAVSGVDVLAQSEELAPLRVDVRGHVYCVCASSWACVADVSTRDRAQRSPYPAACGASASPAAACLVVSAGEPLLCVARRECVLVLHGDCGSEVASSLVLLRRIQLDAELSVPIGMSGDVCSGWVAVLCAGERARGGSRVSLQFRSVHDGVAGAEFDDDESGSLCRGLPTLASFGEERRRSRCRIGGLLVAWPCGAIRTLRMAAPPLESLEPRVRE